MLHISIQSEYIIKFGGFLISNTLLCSLLTAVLLVLISFRIKKRIVFVPKTFSFQNMAELLIEKLYNFVDSVTGNKRLSEQVFPLVATFFIFIVAENLLALAPGFLGAFFVKIGNVKVPLLRSPNSDINSTIALALIAVGAIQYFGIKNLGLKNYFKRFFNFTNPLKMIVGFFEILGEATKVLSLSLRLFGNVLAGEVLLMVTAFLVPYFIPLPFLVLEFFVGILQAFIFSMLSLVFIKNTQLDLMER